MAPCHGLEVDLYDCNTPVTDRRTQPTCLKMVCYIYSQARTGQYERVQKISKSINDFSIDEQYRNDNGQMHLSKGNNSKKICFKMVSNNPKRKLINMKAPQEFHLIPCIIFKLLRENANVTHRQPVRWTVIKRKSYILVYCHTSYAVNINTNLDVSIIISAAVDEDGFQSFKTLLKGCHLNFSKLLTLATIYNITMKGFYQFMIHCLEYCHAPNFILANH